MADKAACIVALKKNFKDALPDTEITKIVNATFEELGEGVRFGEALNEASARIVETVRETLTQRRLDVLQDIEKFGSHLRFLTQDSSVRDIDEALSAIVLGGSLDTGLVGGGRGIAVDAAVLINETSNMFLQELQIRGGLLQGRPNSKSKHLMKILSSGKLDREIHMEYRNPGSSKVREAAEIAKAIRKVNNKLHHDKVQAGSGAKYRKDRITTRRHDLDKIGHTDADFDAWAGKLMDPDGPYKVDWKATMGSKDLAERRKFLKNVFENMMSERAGLDLEDAVPGDVGRAGVRRGDFSGQVRKKREIVFADGESEFNYNRDFGKGTLNEQITHDIFIQSNQAAAIRHLGSRPYQMLERVQGAALMIGRDRKIPSEDLARLEAGISEGKYRTFLETAIGDDHVPANNLPVKMLRAGRTFLASTLLGNAVIASVTEQGMMSHMLRSATGMSWARSQMEWATSFFKHIPGKHRAELAKEFGLIMDSGTGIVLSRMGLDRPGELPRQLEGIMDAFFRLNLLSQQTAAHREAGAMSLAYNMARERSVSFESLHPKFKASLEGFGFNKADWQVMRTAPMTKINGQDAMLRSNFRNASQADIRAGMREKMLQTGRKFTQAEYLRELELSYMAFMNVNSNMGTGTPGARERAILRRFGGKPGTVFGEITAGFWQFSSYPLVVGRMLKRMTMSEPDQLGRPLHERLANASTMMAVTAFMAQLTALGYVRLALNDMSRGMTPRDPTIDPMRTFREAFQAGGAAGLATPFIFAAYERNAGVLGQMAGPGFSALDNVSGIWSAAQKGDVDGTARAALKTGLGVAPNLFYTHMVFNNLFMYNLREMASPGYTRRLESRAEERGQKFLIQRPTEALPW